MRLPYNFGQNKERFSDPETFNRIVKGGGVLFSFLIFFLQPRGQQKLVIVYSSHNRTLPSLDENARTAIRAICPYLWPCFAASYGGV